MNRDATSFQPLDNSSLRTQIEIRVRDAVLNGSLRSGDRIVESTIAGQLGVSRAPVREALSALEREGLIVLSPRPGRVFADVEIDIPRPRTLELKQSELGFQYSAKLRRSLAEGAAAAGIDLATQETESLASDEEVIAR